MPNPSQNHLYACRRLIRFIRQNCGVTADWPMEITFDDDAVEEEFQNVWDQFVQATNDASPIFPQIKDWDGASNPECSSRLHD